MLTVEPIGSELALARTLAIVEIIRGTAACVGGEHDAVLVGVLRAVALAEFQVELENECGM